MRMAGIRIGLGRLHDLVLVLRRSVDRVKSKRLGPGVADIVTRAGRDNHGEVALHRVFAAVDIDGTLSFLDTEELVAVGMDFLADLFPG